MIGGIVDAFCGRFDFGKIDKGRFFQFRRHIGRKSDIHIKRGAFAGGKGSFRGDEFQCAEDLFQTEPAVKCRRFFIGETDDGTPFGFGIINGAPAFGRRNAPFVSSDRGTGMQDPGGVVVAGLQIDIGIFAVFPGTEEGACPQGGVVGFGVQIGQNILKCDQRFVLVDGVHLFDAEPVKGSCSPGGENQFPQM